MALPHSGSSHHQDTQDHYSFLPVSIRLGPIHIPALWHLTLCLHSSSKSQVVLSPPHVCSSLRLTKRTETTGIQASTSWTNILTVSMEPCLCSAPFPPWGPHHHPWWSIGNCPSAGQGWCKTSCNLGEFSLLLDDTGTALGRMTAVGARVGSPPPIYLFSAFSNNSVWIKFSASPDQYCLRWQPESRKAIPGNNIRALQWKTKVNRLQYESTSGFIITRLLNRDWLLAKLPFFFRHFKGSTTRCSKSSLKSCLIHCCIPLSEGETD